MIQVVIVYPDGSQTRHRVRSAADAEDVLRRIRRLGYTGYVVQG